MPATNAGIHMMDAPVSGGEPKAIDGTLSIMCGGPKALFDKYFDLLKVMGASVVHCGDVNGAGNTVKLANQIIVACNIAACAEAYSLSTMAGVNPEELFEEGYTPDDLALMTGWDANLKNPVPDGYIQSDAVVTSVSYNFIHWTLAFGKMLGIDLPPKTFGL